MSPLLLHRRSKFGNRQTACVTQGHALHASRLEATYCNRLLARQQRQEIVSFKTQVGFCLYGLHQTVVCTHIVDFLVQRPDGHQEAHEIKGYRTDLWVLKRKLFLDNYPDIAYRVIGRPTGRQRGAHPFVRQET